MHDHSSDGPTDPALLPVSFTMSLLAVLVAVATLLAHRAHTHEVVAQIKATDAWSEYEAVNTRRHSYEALGEFIEITPPKDPAQAEKARQKFQQQAERYDKRREEVRREGEDFEGQVQNEERRANRFDFGETLLEVSLVITSITLLTRRRAFWYLGNVIGAFGIVVAVTGILIKA